MSKIVTISDDLATLLEERARRMGATSLDAAAEALIADAIVANDIADDHADGRSNDALRSLIDAADASGPAAVWDAAATRTEVLRRFAARQR